MASAKIQRTIARQQEKISEGQYYEAHQQLRVIANRYVKSSDWGSAVSILASGASLLLKAGQGGSGGDLCIFLVDVYTKAELAPDAESRARLVELLRAFPAGEPTRKRFVGDLIGWSARFGEYPSGDPELHHVAGSVYADDDDLYEAEKHLILGTRDSPSRLAALEHSFYASDAVHTAANWAGRAVLPYLLVGNVRGANQSLLLFNSKLGNDASLGVENVSGSTADVRVYPSLPLLNFLGLLLLAVQRGAADLFRQLKSRYAAHLKETPEWSEALDRIGEMYFGIKIPHQGNPLFDMMAGLLGGGGGAGGQRRRQGGRVEAPPASGLD